MKKQQSAKCPLCNKSMNKLFDDGVDYMGWYCPKLVHLEYPDVPMVKSFPHYKDEQVNDIKTIIIYPYRIVLEKHQTKIAVHVDPKSSKATHGYKVGKMSFKTLVTCPPIHMDTEDKLLSRIKTLIVLS